MALTNHSTTEPSRRRTKKGTSRPMRWLRIIEIVRAAVSGRITKLVYQRRLVDIFPHHRVSEDEDVHPGAREHHERLHGGGHHWISARVERRIEERRDPELVAECGQ